MRQVWCKVKKSGQWGRVGRVGKGRGQGNDRNATPEKAESRGGREVNPSVVQCRGEKMARRGRVFGATQCKVNQWTNNQMKQGCGWWSDLLCSLRVVAQWGKEGGDGPTVLVVLCTGQAVDFGGTLAGHFSRLATSVTVFSPCLKATATCCVVLCCCMVCCGVMSQDARRKRKKRHVALTLEVTHDGDDDEGVS